MKNLSLFISKEILCEKIYIAFINGGNVMKKTYKVDVDCAACAEKMQEAIKNTEGVKDAVLSFMTLKCKVEFEDGVDPDEVIKVARDNCKKIEDEFEIFF